MDYTKILNFLSNFFSREMIKKHHENQSISLENFIQKTNEIRKQSIDENDKEKIPATNRLNAQVRGLTGANKVNYQEFVLLSSYFDSNTFISDYRIFALNRHSFKIKLSTDKMIIKSIIVQEDEDRKNLKYYKGLILIFILITLLFQIIISPKMYEWLADDWRLPNIAQGILIQGFLVLLLIFCFRIFIDYSDYQMLKIKIQRINARKNPHV